MYYDLWSSFDFENVDANLPSVTPPPLESFEEMLKALDREDLDVDLDVDFQFPPVTLPLPDISSPTRQVASTQPQSTYSMPGLTDTEYSSMSTSTSNYPALFNPARRDIILGFEYNNVDPKHSPATSESMPMFPQSQHDHVFMAQPDNGPDHGIYAHCPSTAIARPPPAIPNDPPVSSASTSRVFTGPIRTKHTKKPKKPMEPTRNRCDHCGRDIKGKSNLKDHMKTHDPNRERPFVCPESDCPYPRFFRSNDLKRHRENINIHGVQGAE